MMHFFGQAVLFLTTVAFLLGIVLLVVYELLLIVRFARRLRYEGREGDYAGYLEDDGYDPARTKVLRWG
jgi:hypothetical protein